jgi:hypothetical protein
MTVWRMRIACWITRATDIHSEYVIFLLLHGNNGYANATQCYIIYTLSVLWYLVGPTANIQRLPFESC